ncbi:MAG: CPBP family intramembrane glutamic endopeptidase [Candidatus Micrarchaeota archaeon]
MTRIFLILSILSILSFLTVLGCQAAGFRECSFISENATLFGSAAIHVGLLSLALFFLWKGGFRKTLESVGFPGDIKTTAVFTVVTLGAVFTVLLVLGVIFLVAGFSDQQKVSDKIGSLPLYMLVFAALAAPVSEELFFRGLLVQRWGILPSSLVFGLMHFAYGSVMEVVGAFSIGLVLAASFRLSKSITPPIIVHIVYNTIAIAFMRLYS